MKRLKKIFAVAISAVISTVVMAANMSADEEFLISSDDSRYKYIEKDDGTIAIAASQYSMTGIKGEVVIPSKLDGKNVSAIAASGFSGCDITKVTIPDTVSAIGSLAFANCLELKTVEFPSSLTSMGVTPFSQTAYETELLKNSDPDFAVINDTILYLYTGSDTNIEVPDGIRIIADSAFANNGAYSNNKIASVTLPDGVEYIGANSFENCAELTKMIIRTGLKEVGKNAISNKINIYGYSGTFAETFAETNGNTFTALIPDGETKIECSYDQGFKQYYFSTDTEFSKEGIHIYKRYSNGTREELTNSLDWTLQSSPAELYAQEHSEENE